MTEPFKMFAMVTNQGTAMSETALCSEHYVDPYIGFARTTGEGADDIGEDRTFHDCTDNDELACVECGASTPEQEWLVTFTKQVTARTYAEAVSRADDGKGGGNWEATPADEVRSPVDGLTRKQRDDIGFWNQFNVPVAWFVGPERDNGSREAIALGEGFAWSLMWDEDSVLTTSEAKVGKFSTGIEI
jgi:hypothetical protein